MVFSETARQTEVIDPDEEFVHVEWPNESNAYKRPVLWRRRAWMEHYARYQNVAERCRIYSRIFDAEMDVIRRLTRQLNHYRRPFGDKKIEVSNQERAALLVKTRNLATIKFFSVNLDCLVAADRELAEYRQKMKEKKV